MADETATNPVDGEDTANATLPETQEVEAQDDQQEFDDDGNLVAQEPEDEEIELDDLKLKVPKAAAEKLKALKEGNLRQEDYTRKTQALAEDRKAVQAERDAVAQASQAEIGALAQVGAIDQQLANFQKVDWDAWENEDPFEAQKGWRQFQTLQQNRQQAVQQYTGLRQKREFDAQQATAKRLEAGRVALARDIKGWGPELGEALLSTGVKEYGFERSEIEDSFDDPRLIKVLHDAHLYRQSLTKTQKAQTRQAEQTAKPAAKVGGGSAPPAGLDDRISTAEWMKRRNAQDRKRA